MFLARSLFRMSAHNPLLRLEQRAAEADQIIEYLKQQVQLLKEKAMVQASVREEKKLMVENAKLRNDIEELKKQLLEKERLRGVCVTMTSGDSSVECKSVPAPPAASGPPPAASPPAAVQSPPPKAENKKKKPEKKGGDKAEKKQATPSQDEAKVDVSRLDLRVGSYNQSREASGRRQSVRGAGGCGGSVSQDCGQWTGQAHTSGPDAEPYGHPALQPEASQDERCGVPGHGHVCQLPRQSGNPGSSRWSSCWRQNSFPGISR
ncbi:hypothetical protein fugu_008143 [Takifugu bimaculatus]|uniref:Uncharacterized protein n=1 Tax=Takifugu bimaculatus TaxID=433685 RepID=A0A4Z2B0I7_9TELE|nr:hypothetical protein fugu_008143 [Takifugu bimaculatus]